MHGGPEVTPGRPLHDTYLNENLVILVERIKNRSKHIQNARKFGLKVIVRGHQSLTSRRFTHVKFAARY